ncbi:hypothetical protein RB195_001046 [Necator americanus]|uniref:Tyrosyl-DNA phosphodiesterase n=1 Tax=Necator americanus TaxID=51031 RepID=A0ABR1DE24_NECAM
MKCESGSAVNSATGISASNMNALSSSGLLSGGMYFTRVDVLPDRFNVDAFNLSDILQIIRPQLSIHFNFMIDIEWLLQQYPAPCRGSPIICVVGEKMGTDKKSLQAEVDVNKWSNVSVLGATLPIPFGTHHTKLSIFESETKLHVVVSTANLIEGDWDQKTQCFYYATGTFSDGDTTENEFANDLCDYLAEYHLPDITYWIDRIRNSEFTGISDRLLFSVPGYHKSSRISKFGHPSLLRLLGDRPTPKEDARRLFLAQCSSIGSLGDKREAWLLPQFLHSLQGGKSLVFSRLFLIYPCVEDVRHSLEGYSAGDSLPYQESTSKRQPWLREIMCKWRSEGKGRTKAMPHVKTYTEIVDGVPQWILITSANLSKAAWGDFQKNKTQLMVRSYELGVLIMDPERIKLPYDYPVVKYSQKDDPWICDMSYTEADSHGRQWIVSRR